MAFKSSLKFDVKKLKQLQRTLNKLNKTEIEWGWINGKAYNKGDINKRGGVPYALIAIRNEFGGYVKQHKLNKFVYIPARPYFQQSTKGSVTYVKRNSAKVFMLAVMGGDYKSHLQTIANAQVDILKESISRNNMKPLHPKTIAIKDSDKQWDDTGKLIENITAKVIYKRADYRGGSDGTK